MSARLRAQFRTELRAETRADALPLENPSTPDGAEIRLGLGTTTQIAACVALTAACVYAATAINGYYVFVLANVALMAIVGIGLNVLIGFTGQISFGHVGFYAIGAYAVAVLGLRWGFSFWIAWPIATALAGAIGYLLAQPALRVKGPYLAMVTIAFGFIVEHSVIELRSLTGGQNGLMNLSRPGLFAFAGSERTVAVVAIVAAAIALALFRWLSRGAWGAAMRAVRDSDVAAESIGIDPLVVKTVAFAGSAALAGLAGGLFAPLSGFVTPGSFAFQQSIMFVLVVMIGGAGSFAGPLVGAIIVGVLPEVLASLEEYRLLFFGALLLAVLWVAPDGLVGLAQRASLRWRNARNARVEPSASRDPVGVTVDRGARHTGPEPTLHVSGLTMRFGGVTAVSELEFDVPPRAITGLIGPNGAGKTTALNMLSGFYAPSDGAIALGGKALTGRRAFQIARSGVARSYQTSQLFGSLSVADNIALGDGRGRLGGLLSSRSFRADDVRSRAVALLDFCGYAGSPEVCASDLAHVDRRLVEIARALATRPHVLLLDEPAAGLAQADKLRLGDLVRKIADTGVGVVLVEHDMGLVMRICDRIVVLDAGRRLAIGTPAEIRGNTEVRQAYLGETGTDVTVSRRPVGPDITPARELLGVGHLTTGYGVAPVLNHVELQVCEGQAVALLGANGAGKSTLMRSLGGLHRPVSGGIHFDGRDMVSLRTEQIVAAGMILVPEGRQVFAELSVLDNLRLGAFLRPRDRDKRLEHVLVRFPRLRERLHQRAGLLSGGEQQMLAIGRGLMAQPKLLLLDEPSLGLAPKMISELFAALDALRRESISILLVDQMASLALALADRAYVMESGRIVAKGAPDAIARDPALANAYLGGEQVTP